MIIRETVDKIIDTARIDEVVGDFVHLKKRGTSLIGNCPFHGEKTPSFHVSVSKGIYKCFGCGKVGDSIGFVMEHEKYSYPEALKYLANKYNIEVEETVETQQDLEAQNARESLYVVSAFAASFFEDQLWNGEEGKAIGLSYFKERGFREDIIKKFNLGYSPDVWDALTAAAVKNQHSLEFLEKTGLSIKNDNGKVYDRFRGRVMFPIHNFTGRIIGFGGRTLKTDKNVPKYVNSPENEIYHKSNMLYGLFHAKKAIRDADNCYLVEGYADVLSVHQAYIENVVASSGTSLTVEQIRLIARFTKNVTILYDSDAAGIKASLRGLDMILEEGLNVKVVSFPAGDDPDSYMHKVGAGAFKAYIEDHRKDFILYKANVLLADAGNDPIKKAGIIHDIVESIAKIPDQIKASIFVKECSHLLEIEERVLLGELNKIRAAKFKKVRQESLVVQQHNNDIPSDNQFDDNEPIVEIPSSKTDKEQEMEVLRVLITYGNELVYWDKTDNMYIGSFILQNLTDVVFKNELLDRIVKHYWDSVEKGSLPTMNSFIHNEDKEVANISIDLSSSRYELSPNWEKKHNIHVKHESMHLKKTVIDSIFHLKKKKIEEIKKNVALELKEEKDPVNVDILVNKYSLIKIVEMSIAKHLGNVILE